MQASPSVNPSTLQGVGIGLRQTNIVELLERKPDIGWLEVLADNHLAPGGLGHYQLQTLCEHYPIALHCVGMSLGSADAIDKDYLVRIKALAEQYQACVISDHLCFVSTDGIHFHDLLPLPYTKEAMQHTVNRIKQVQDILQRQILVENVSSYLSYKDSTMDEVDFLNEVVEQADCGILLDLNNLYISAYNHKFDVMQAVSKIHFDRVGQIHLGGFLDKKDYLLDAHSRPVSEAVWDLFQEVMPQVVTIPVLIEWDNEVPPLDVLLGEAQRAKTICIAAEAMLKGVASCN